MKLTPEALEAFIDYQKAVAAEASANTPAKDILNILVALQNNELQIPVVLTENQKSDIMNNIGTMYMCDSDGSLFEIEKRICMLAGAMDCSTDDVLDVLRAEERVATKGEATPVCDGLAEDVDQVKQDMHAVYQTAKQRKAKLTNR